jgi:hypothetical protein
MRVGQNPAKSVETVAQPEKVTVAVVSYIPALGGYYSESLDVFKTCLESIWAHTKVPYDLMVFDNASCPEVRDFLTAAQADGKIQYLTLSEQNIGKAGAWNFIFGAAPGDYIAYADSDVYHHPGWLKPQIELLETFPETGMVTGMPMWTPEEFSTATVAWAEHNPAAKLERGKFLAWEDYWQHSQSLGKEESYAREKFESIQEAVIEYQGQRYFIGAAHFQFVARKSALQTVLPIPSERPMGQVRRLDVALNAAGYLRFSTPDLWVQHMGNTLRAEFKTSQTGTPQKSGARSTGGWRKNRLVRKISQVLYHQAFNILYKD